MTAGAGKDTALTRDPRGSRPAARRWREMLSEFPAIRQVFHALCALGESEDATGLLGFAARQEWMAGLARRFGSLLARFDDTMACEPGDDFLAETLWQLYAASRVRDALLLAHQPALARRCPCAKVAGWGHRSSSGG